MKRKHINGKSNGNTNGKSLKRLSLMGKKYNGIINEITSPIDATNRFINLALHSIGDHSQGRQFLLESKQGIKKTTLLLKKLNDYSKKIESEIRGMVDANE